MTTIDIRKAALRLAHQTLETGGGSASIVCGVPSPTNGYMVALPGRERVVQIGDTKDRFARIKTSVEHYATLHRAVLSQPGNFLGTWMSDGNLVLDVSVNLFELNRAVEQGWTTGQDAIYDLETGVDIQTRPQSQRPAFYTHHADQESADLIAWTNNLAPLWYEARGLSATV